VCSNRYYIGYYTVLSAFTMIDAKGTNHKVYLIRNPYGCDYNYKGAWNATDPNWTDALVAQVPFGIDPRVSKGPDTVSVLKYDFYYE